MRAVDGDDRVSEPFRGLATWLGRPQPSVTGETTEPPRVGVYGCASNAPLKSTVIGCPV